MAQPEPNIPDDLLAKLQYVAPLLENFFGSDGSLKMGGGTILQARWGHRVSTDIDLFISPRRYFQSVGIESERNELLLALSDSGGIDPGSLRVNTFGVYCEIYGTELTIAPVESHIIEDRASGFLVPGTNIETEANSTILVKKIYNRIMVDNRYEVRDIFDIAVSTERDSSALEEIFSRIPRDDVIDLMETLKKLPASWIGDTEKPLIGVDAALGQEDLISIVCDFLQLNILQADRTSNDAAKMRP